MSQHNHKAEDMAKMIAELQAERAENAKLKEALAKSKGNGKLSFKVGDKGGVSVYGINNKFPVTLYQEQWTKLLEAGPQILEFIKANKSKLATVETRDERRAAAKAAEVSKTNAA